MPNHTHNVIKFKTLREDSKNECEFVPTEEQISEIADSLGVKKFEKARLKISLTSKNEGEWSLHGMAMATVTQACVLTLEDFKTRYELPIERLFTPNLADFEEQNRSETDLDDRVEELPSEIDMITLIQEAISLALPDFPKKPGAELSTVQLEAADSGPESSPFEALAALKDQLETKPDKG